MNKPIEAICVITNSKNITGYILLKEDLENKETIIKIRLKDVPPGKHGFHIHASGDLRHGCKTLCSHYNPYNKQHGVEATCSLNSRVEATCSQRHRVEATCSLNSRVEATCSLNSRVEATCSQRHRDIKSKNRHVGDLGNIKPNKDGIVNKIIRDKLVKLRGKYSVIGRSMVIHEDADDLGLVNNKESLKTGNAGKRIACGIIGYLKKFV
jgi:Cu-Zn family superoxide dismutase